MKEVLFHQDNTSAYKTLVSIVAVCECGFELIDHTHYTPDLASSDYRLFPNMKKHFVGNQYRSNDKIISAVDDIFDQQDKIFFQNWI